MPEHPVLMRIRLVCGRINRNRQIVLIAIIYLQAGFTAVHLAAQNGHGQVLEVMRTSQSLRISSKKLGVTALHVAAYFGQAGELLLVSFESLDVLNGY